MAQFEPKILALIRKSLISEVMEVQGPFYLHKLKHVYNQRQRVNPSYSIRAFARDLGLDSSNVSAIFNGKRALPAKRAKNIAKKLNLQGEEASLFYFSTHNKPGRLDKIKVSQLSKKYLMEDRFAQVISEWEYVAVLQLFNTENFLSDHNWIAERLSISVERVKEVLLLLQELKLIEKDKEGLYQRNCAPIETSEEHKSEAIQFYHKEILRLSSQKLTETPVHLRDYSAITMAIDISKLDEAKQLIREFQDKLNTFLTEANSSEVYTLSCQLFPLTQVQTDNQKENEGKK